MAAGKITIDTSINRKGFKAEAKAMIVDADGFAKKLGSSVSQGSAVASKALTGLKKLMAAVLSVAAIVAFGKASVQAAREYGDAMYGMQSIVEGQGRSFDVAKDFIQSYIQDGLVPATDAITAYKSLALRGYDDSQIRAVMTALKDSAAYGRQASYSMGEAISSAAEGLKNENSILVDNAGVTKNVAKMWDEYARSIGTTANNLTQQQKIQAEVNGILEETRFQTGDAAKVAGTFSGQMMQLGFSFNNLKVAVGNAIIPIIRAILPAVNVAINALTTLFNVFGKVTAAIFGGSASEMKVAEAATGGLAEAAFEGAAGENALAGATKKASKEARNGVASFDDLNVLQKGAGISDGGSGGAGTGGGAVSSIPAITEPVVKDSTTIPWLDSLKSKVLDITSLFAPSIAAWGNAFENLKQPVSNALSIVKNSLSDLWKGGLSPLAAYTTTVFIPDIVNGFSNTFAPIFTDVAAAAVEQFALDFEFSMGMVTNIINDMVLPSLEGFKTFVLDIFGGVGTAWAEFGAGIIAQWAHMKEQVRGILQNLYDTVILPIFTSLGDTLSWLWTNHLQPLWANLTTFFAALIETVLTLWDNVLLPFINWIVSILGPVFAATVGQIGAVFGTVFGTIADVIGGVLKSLKGILEFITGVFTLDWRKAWKGVQDVFTGVWDAITGVIKGAINICIDCINGLVGGITAGMNAVIGAINALSFTVPSWVPGFGGNKIGFDIPTITAPKIPKLAAGAVIPPNREFLAILGDQRHGTNIEAPLETIMQAMRTVMAEGGAGSREIVIRFAGELAALVRLLKPYIDEEDGRVGASLIEGGAY